MAGVIPRGELGIGLELLLGFVLVRTCSWMKFLITIFYRVEKPRCTKD